MNDPQSYWQVLLNQLDSIHTWLYALPIEIKIPLFLFLLAFGFYKIAPLHWQNRLYHRLTNYSFEQPNDRARRIKQIAETPERYVFTFGKVSVAYRLTVQALTPIHFSPSKLQARIDEINSKMNTIFTADQKADIYKFDEALGITIIAFDSPYLRETSPAEPQPLPPRPPLI